MTLIVGFGHYSRTGKDTTANALVSALNSRGVKAVKRSFAGPLKALCHELYGDLGLQDQAFYDKKENEHLRNTPIPKVQKTPVEIWVQVGMLMREVYPRTWIENALKKEEGVKVFVFADVRFPNEFEEIEGLGGDLTLVVRPGVKPRDTEADQALVGWEGRWHQTIGESGDILELVTWAENKAINIVTLLKEKP